MNCKIRVFLVLQKEFEKMDELLPKNLLPVSKTKLVHQVIWVNSNKHGLCFRYLSCTDCLSTHICNHYSLDSTINYSNTQISFLNNINSNGNYLKDTWVVVIYDKKWYPGVIIEIEGNILITKFLARNGKNFSWPQVDDVQKVFPNQVLCQTEAPLKYNGKKKQKTAANILTLCFLQMYLLLLHIISYSLNHLLAAINNVSTEK